LKIDQPGETLWDLFKLTAAFRQRSLEAAYLVIPASEVNWGADAACCELFPPNEGERATHESIELFRRNDKAWRRLLGGGRGRPVRPEACEDGDARRR
ncbi:MAG: hypothetical protein ACRDMA_11605, partial [Solirubrobacterales bacterium]